MSLYGVIAVAVVMLAGALVICARVAASRQRRVDALERSLESARGELRRLGEYQAKREEAQKHAEEKKAALHTGDSGDDFDNSLKLLHRAAGRDKGS